MEDHKLFKRASAEAQIIGKGMPEASLDYVSLEEELQFVRALMVNKDTKKLYTEYATMKIYHWILTFHNLKITDFMTEWVEDQFNNIFLHYAYVIDLDKTNLGPVKAPNFIQNVMMENALFNKYKSIPDAEDEEQKELRRRKMEEEELEYEKKIDVMKNAMRSKFKGTLKHFRIRTREVKVANSYMDHKLKKLNDILDPNSGKSDVIQAEQLRRKENLKRYIRQVRKQNKLNMDGTSSFMSPDRAKANISIQEGQWLKLQPIKAENQGAKKLNHAEKLKKILHMRGGRRKNKGRRGDKRMNFSFSVDREYTGKSTGDRFYPVVKPNLTTLSFDTSQRRRRSKLDQPKPEIFLKWAWKPSSQDFNRMPTALSPDEVMKPSLSLSARTRIGVVCPFSSMSSASASTLSASSVRLRLAGTRTEAIGKLCDFSMDGILE